MNRIFKIFGILTLGILFAKCEEDDSVGPTPAKPHSEVYPKDLIKIEEYLKTHYVEANDLNGDGDIKIGEEVEVGGELKKEVEIKPLDATHTVSIWDQTEYPLQNKIVKLHGVDFKVYYLKFDGKADTDAEGDKPCGVDRVYVSYEGTLLDGSQFDYHPNPSEFNLAEVIKGWEYMFPEFRAGFFDSPDSDGTLNPRNFGSGVMFLPSGLGYYHQNFGNIPSYSPLVFTFNLFAVTRLDQDFDKIESRYEYAFNSDGSLIDTDSDDIPDIFDADDDNDGYLTKVEIEKPSPYLGPSAYYPFNPFTVEDDPATTEDESVTKSEPKGIPDASGDGTTETRLRRHLDKTAKPPYTVY
ncbi:MULTISPECIES: FKBP-type peptidyl-prolyl cis-trans isomerase [Flavobacterium]|uniref:FKBP-type peptidyl-prolyl cis-trans isomerase n=1 Tax=Flavobacterium TaxID=237 RepID=UPI001FCC748F|nr:MULTISPECIES: hypothetical protein [Flavobacterium]UOK42414.1 hypothetical protein LZF87_14020 [Flavobacterium enshiense]